MLITCEYCGNVVDKPAGHVNRSIKIGAPLFCSKQCFQKSRNKHKTVEQKKNEKAEYDKKRREELKDRLKEERRIAYQKWRLIPGNLEKERAYRKSRMHYHVEYCRRDEYKKYKSAYDRVHRAKKVAGEFWESHILCIDIRDACLDILSDYEIRMSKGTMSKSQKRKREYAKASGSYGGKPKECTLGDLAASEVREHGTRRGRLSSGTGKGDSSDN